MLSQLGKSQGDAGLALAGGRRRAQRVKVENDGRNFAALPKEGYSHSQGIEGSLQNQDRLVRNQPTAMVYQQPAITAVVGSTIPQGGGEPADQRGSQEPWQGGEALTQARAQPGPEGKR